MIPCLLHVQVRPRVVWRSLYFCFVNSIQLTDFLHKHFVDKLNMNGACEVDS